MYATSTPPLPLAEAFSSLATWTQSTEEWTGVLAADPGFEIAWTTLDGRVEGLCLTPASRSPSLVRSAGGPRMVRILRIRPDCVGGLLGVDAPDLVDGVRVTPRDLGPRWRLATNAATEAELFDALARLRAEPDPLVRDSLGRLGGDSFPRIAAEAGYSYAQWRRRMKAATGVSPKFLDRYRRLRRATRLAHAWPSMSMGEIAFRTGYASDCRLAAEASALSGRTFRSLVAGFTLPE